jgi:hypothetical protein
MNNARYLSWMDYGRMHLLVRAAKPQGLKSPCALFGRWRMVGVKRGCGKRSSVELGRFENHPSAAKEAA